MISQPEESKPNPAVVSANRRHIVPKQSLETLGKWRRKWVNAQRTGVKQRAAEPDATFNARQLAYKKRCGDAITEIDRAIAARTAKPVRSSLPKKLQRYLGILPPVGHVAGERVPI